MSHDEGQNNLPGSTPPSSPDYGSFSSRGALPSTSLGSSTGHNQQHTARSFAAMALHASQGLTPMQRWAADASESQFHALSGAVGGFTSGIVTCPLDVIKTKLQAQGGFSPVSKGRHVGHPRVYKGLVGTAGTIWREEGIRGMYRGLGPIILGYLPTWAVWFTVYNKSKVFLGERYMDNQVFINFWSSIIAGASSTVVTNPIWVIKTRLMSQTPVSVFPRSANTPTSRPKISSPWHYHSTLDAARKMYSSEGILAFYSGLTPALLGLTHVAVQFPAYEYLRKKFTGQRMGEMGDEGSKHWPGLLGASILSKFLASSATYPHEVIRTRLQTQRRPTPGVEYLQGLGASSPNGKGEGSGKQAGNGNGAPPLKYRGIITTFRTILREEGWRAFYAGLGVNLMRAVPAATVTMMTYEYVMMLLHHEKKEGQKMRDMLSKSDVLPEP